MTDGAGEDTLAWLVRRLGLPTDPWDSVPAPIPPRLFGRGSRRPFSWYFGGASSVQVSTPAEVERWLLECLYVPDERLFGSDDYWQHPSQFEKIRMGDCDDHALWAWRKLAELGLDASLVAGRWREEPDDLHTWVVASLPSGPTIVEATSKVLGEMLRPFDTAQDAYRPYFSVDRRFRTRAYLGSVRDALLPTGLRWPL